MNDSYIEIQKLLLENQEDYSLLKKVNRLTFGLMISKEPETNNNESRMD